MWDKRHGALLFLNSFGMGVTAPVFSLLLMGQGLSLAGLPLAVGLHSAVAVVFELPSGMAADRWGRKRCFLLACLLQLPCLALLGWGRGPAAALAAVTFLGLSRAFSSGSLDALVVEEYLLKNGREALPGCTARMSVLMSLGQAAGCLAGGGVWAVTDRLWAALALKAAALAVVLALSAGLAEHPVQQAARQNPVRELWATLGGTGAVRALVLYAAALAPPLFSVEIFYQPRFTQLLPGGGAGWVLGALAAGSYFAAAAGSAAGRRALPRPGFKALLAATALLGACLWTLAAAASPLAFTAAYLGFYLVTGSTDYLTGTLMNEAAPPQQRATLLSASSLTLQLGGLAAAPLLAAGAEFFTMPQIWTAMGAAVALGMLAWLAMTRQK